MNRWRRAFSSSHRRFRNSIMDSVGSLQRFSINRQNDALDSGKSLETDFSTPCYCTAACLPPDEIIDPPLGW